MFIYVSVVPILSVCVDLCSLCNCRHTVASQHPGYDSKAGLQAIYIRSTDTFPEEEIFIEQCVVRLVNLSEEGRV